jgi:chaperone modulatory protein CbpM
VRLLDPERAGFICALRRDLAVEEETVPLVLSLLDQIYTLRRQMTALAGAIGQQPEDVRAAILERLEQPRRRGGSLG